MDVERCNNVMISLISMKTHQSLSLRSEYSDSWDADSDSEGNSFDSKSTKSIRLQTKTVKSSHSKQG